MIIVPFPENTSFIYENSLYYSEDRNIKNIQYSINQINFSYISKDEKITLTTTLPWSEYIIKLIEFIYTTETLNLKFLIRTPTTSKTGITSPNNLINLIKSIQKNYLTSKDELVIKILWLNDDIDPPYYILSSNALKDYKIVLRAI